MKKILFMIAAVATLFTACNKDCDHDFIEVDYTNELVGTWTCQEANYTAAFVFNADGTAFTTGVENGEYWEDVQVNWKVVNNKLTLSYGDNTSETLLEIISGEYLSISDKNGDRRKTYKYCANDLSDEIIGMWVCNDYSTGVENDMVIQTFKEDGTVTKTGWSAASNEFIVNETITYIVVGDLVFHQRPSDIVTEGATTYFASKLTYMPNANQLGDMLTNTSIKVINGEAVKLSASMLRVKQNLNLAGKVYDYSSAYVSNAKGKDEDFSIMGNIFNIANIKAGDFDMLFRSVLSSLEFDVNYIKHRIRLDNGQDVVFEDPITVEGNKVTLDMSAGNPALRKVEMYMFQDADDSQLHLYMPTESFENFFSNLQIMMMSYMGQLDTTDATAVEKVFADMEARVESINVSFVFKARN